MKRLRSAGVLVVLGVCLAQPSFAFAVAFVDRATADSLAPVAAGLVPGVVCLAALIAWSLAYSHGQDESSARAAAGGGWDWVEDPEWPVLFGERHRWMLVLPDGAVRDTGSTVTFGSAPDNDVVLSDPSVQPHHAKLQWYGGDLVFTNLSGREAVVGGRQVRGSVSLRRGTTLRLGRTDIAVHRDVSGLGGRTRLGA